MVAVEDLGRALVELALEGRPTPQDERFYRAAWLNWLGVTWSGSRESAVRRFVRSRAALAPGSHRPIGRREGLTLADCVMANCYASSAQAFDDIHFATTTHPAGPVATAILGVAELVPASMGEAVVALAVGMEVECRLALAMFSPGTGSAAGWYTTGMAGGVGAAAAVGRLLGLDGDAMDSALGWAATTACGVRGTHGSAAGTFVPALAARAGLEAALLARDGVGCGLAALTGANGLVCQVASSPDFDRALEGMGTTWVSRETSAKPYPFGFVSFAAVDAALELCGIDHVGHIDVYVSEGAARLGGNPMPMTTDEALVSIPYLVARTLADPTSVVRPLSGVLQLTARERALLASVGLHVDADLSDSQARIAIDGSHAAACGAAKGSAARALTVGETIGKFRSICDSLGTEADAIAHAVMEGDGGLLDAARTLARENR